MLQNRVDPKGDLIKTTARGAWMGNRGVIHDERQHIVRPFKLKAWLICLLDFKDRRRQVMTPDRYTELFFLDEATAFAAGHRPCAECRRKAFNRFKQFWLEANPEYGFNERTPIWKIDEVLHKERINRSGKKITFTESAGRLPSGSFILHNNEPYLFADRLFFRWTPGGYDDGISLTGADSVEVLTPRSVVYTFRAGYKPQMATATRIAPR
ncbi:MAG TPA: hypothetical protein VFE32_18980 [Puia sp.]|jgi:hypothetical protein|nr:hypothetical protein [Puia sp.]